MTTLHLVSHPDALERGIASASAGDALLLIGDGVYAAIGPGAWPPALTIPAYALDEALHLRGLDADRIAPAVRRLDYPGFVDLTVQHERIVSWG